MSTAPQFRVLACDAVVGGDVLDARGQALGRIAHIVIDACRGRIAYAVVGRGGVFGIGDTLFAIPWSALSYDEADGVFLLHQGGERLDPTRGFHRDRWPAMEDPAWARAVHSEYRAAPYWEEVVL